MLLILIFLLETNKKIIVNKIQFDKQKMCVFLLLDKIINIKKIIHKLDEMIK